ncbi:MAG: hypothetical protein WC234_04430, partial [Endomicrobiaceae bacterium]
MENLRETLMSLCVLQEKDIKLEKLKNELEDLPKSVEQKKQELVNIKKEFDSRKETYVKLNSLKKEKEALLVAKESLIGKYTTDLNNVKSNDVYKSCLLEIEKAKADKSVIEDEILQLMEEIDKEAVNLKQYEEDYKKSDIEINDQIKGIQSSADKIKEELENMKLERESASKN